MKTILKQFQPAYLLAILLGYGLGLGLVSYLGKPILIHPVLLGIGIIFSLVVSTQYFAKYFQIITFSEPSGEEFKNRNVFLIIGMLFLTLSSIFILTALLTGIYDFMIWMLLLFAFIVNLANAVPPLSLKARGYESLVCVFNIAVFAPLFAFVLQQNELHPTLLLLTFPSIFLLIALFLALSLKSYYEDLQKKRKTIMTVIGWQKGMHIHNLFILLTYFVYGVAGIVGLPWRLVFSAFLSLPFAGLQFWLMWQIGAGYKPRWKLLRLAAITSVGLLGYFLLFSLWIG